jgi:hypothetical protein
MLGCTLFAILYGASPGECEFVRATGQLRIVDCTHNKILGPIPKPSPDTPTANWYSPQIKELLEWILTQDRHARPNLLQVQSRVQELLQQGINRSGGGASVGGGGMERMDHANDLESEIDVENQVDIMFSSKSVL